MNKTIVAVLLLFAIPALAQAPGKPMPPRAVLVPASSLRWGDVPGATGVQMAVAQGDPTKGPAHFFLKFAPGFSAPLHHHTANHHVTVLAGTLVLKVDGAETKLPAGSYFAFIGMKPHTTSCEAGAECVLSIDSRAKWDVVPEQAAAGEAKK